LIPAYSNKTILIAPLDWGLGHAARCVPLIQHYALNNSIIVGYTSLTKSFLEKELKNLSVKWVELPSYNITYSRYWPAWLTVLSEALRIKKVIRKENLWLQNSVVEHQIDLIISDNRFGLYHPQIESVIITHQLNIQAPFFKNQATNINLAYIRKFKQVWIPDESNHLLSGNLSKVSSQLNHWFIGPLSRFTKQNLSSNEENILILLSGPEPQRSILEKKLIQRYANQPNVVLIRGTEKEMTHDVGQIKILNVADKAEVLKFVVGAKKIICRSGYSTLMDLYAIGVDLKNVTLIPTPGQTEQEYLANYWKQKFGCEVLKQNEI